MSGVTVAGGTKIEWADFTFNPWWGCERVSPGCAHCYADTLARRRQPGVQLWGEGHTFRFFGDGHWAEPLKWARLAPAKLGRRPRVFCASMADVFEDRIELMEHRIRLFDLIEATPELDWLVLTKRPENARDWVEAYGSLAPFPNVWLGVSIENSRFTWRADVLREIPAAVRFISAEPLLGSLFRLPDGRRLSSWAIDEPRAPLELTGIDWVIVGGESGPGARPFHLEHAREIVQHCLTFASEGIGRVAHLPPRPAVFVKQLGSKPVGGMDVGTQFYIPLRDRKGGDPSEWPEDLRIREHPASVAA